MSCVTRLALNALSFFSLSVSFKLEDRHLESLGEAVKQIKKQHIADLKTRVTNLSTTVLESTKEIQETDQELYKMQLISLPHNRRLASRGMYDKEKLKLDEKKFEDLTKKNAQLIAKTKKALKDYSRVDSVVTQDYISLKLNFENPDEAGTLRAELFQKAERQFNSATRWLSIKNYDIK